MSNPVKGTVSATIDDKAVSLSMGMNEWCELEDELGVDTSDILARFQGMAEAEKIEMRFFRSLFRAMLSSAHPDVTHAEAGKVAARMGMVGAFELLGRVLMASMPEADETGEGADKQPGKPNRKARRAAATANS